MTPVAGGLIVGGPLSAKLAARFGTRAVVAAGLTVVAAALVLTVRRRTRARATG